MPFFGKRPGISFSAQSKIFWQMLTRIHDKVAPELSAGNSGKRPKPQIEVNAKKFCA